MESVKIQNFLLSINPGACEVEIHRHLPTPQMSHWDIPILWACPSHLSIMQSCNAARPKVSTTAGWITSMCLGQKELASVFLNVVVLERLVETRRGFEKLVKIMIFWIDVVGWLLIYVLLYLHNMTSLQGNAQIRHTWMTTTAVIDHQLQEVTCLLFPGVNRCRMSWQNGRISRFLFFV